MTKIDKKFIINLQGSEFIKFEGLLDAFHSNGGKSIKTEIIFEEPLIIQATAEGERGIFQGIGDADDNNVNKLIARHKIRMAETRAIARALRWYNNIGMCSAEELGGDDKKKKPYLTQSKFDDMLNFIELGKVDIVKEKMKEYTIGANFKALLERAIKNTEDKKEEKEPF